MQPITLCGMPDVTTPSRTHTRTTVLRQTVPLPKRRAPSATPPPPLLRGASVFAPGASVFAPEINIAESRSESRLSDAGPFYKLGSALHATKARFPAAPQFVESTNRVHYRKMSMSLPINAHATDNRAPPLTEQQAALEMGIRARKLAKQMNVHHHTRVRRLTEPSLDEDDSNRPRSPSAQPRSPSARPRSPSARFRSHSTLDSHGARRPPSARTFWEPPTPAATSKTRHAYPQLRLAPSARRRRAPDAALPLS